MNFIAKSLIKLGVPQLWDAQTQRPLEHFSVGHDFIPQEKIAARNAVPIADARQQLRRLTL